MTCIVCADTRKTREALESNRDDSFLNLMYFYEKIHKVIANCINFSLRGLRDKTLRIELKSILYFKLNVKKYGS